jgi:hypothetical protein
VRLARLPPSVAQLLREADAPLKRLRPSLPVPKPTVDEPSDDELLCFMDGVLVELDRAVFAARLMHHPHALARCRIVTEALIDSGPRSGSPE